MKKPPDPAASHIPTCRPGLFQLGRDAAEVGVQLRADRVDDGDDGNRDASSDQTVFDRGRTRLVLEKRNNLGHSRRSRLFALAARGGTKVPPAGKEFLLPITPTRINKSLPRDEPHDRLAIGGDPGPAEGVKRKKSRPR